MKLFKNENTACMTGMLIVIAVLAYVFCIAMQHPELADPDFDGLTKFYWFLPAVVGLIAAIACVFIPVKETK